MENICHPTKEQIRNWLADRWMKHVSIPDAEQIRKELGWKARTIPNGKFVQQPNLSNGTGLA